MCPCGYTHIDILFQRMIIITWDKWRQKTEVGQKTIYNLERTNPLPWICGHNRTQLFCATDLTDGLTNQFHIAGNLFFVGLKMNHGPFLKITWVY